MSKANQFSGLVSVQPELFKQAVLEIADGGGGGSVDSVNGLTGEVILDASSVGAIDISKEETYDNYNDSITTLQEDVGTNSTNITTLQSETSAIQNTKIFSYVYDIAPIPLSAIATDLTTLTVLPFIDTTEDSFSVSSNTIEILEDCLLKIEISGVFDKSGGGSDVIEICLIETTTTPTPFQDSIVLNEVSSSSEQFYLFFVGDVITGQKFDIRALGSSAGLSILQPSKNTVWGTEAVPVLKTVFTVIK